MKDLSKHYNVAFQKDRFPSALAPESVKLDSRTFDDLLLQCARLAKRMHYFGDDGKDRFVPGSKSHEGSWLSFFESIYDRNSETLNLRALREMEKAGTVPPHMALLMAFLRLFAIEQDHLNELTGKHLDFYYRDCLRFSPREGTIGNVPVTIKLVKGQSKAIIPSGTRFPAGKDEEGKVIFYKSSHDYTVTSAELRQKELINASKDSSRYGFALSTPAFNFQYGKAKLRFSDESQSIVRRISTIEYTSKDGWKRIRARVITETPKSRNSISMARAKVYLEFSIPENAPITGYDALVHGSGFDTKDPVIRIIPDQKMLQDLQSKKAEIFKIQSFSLSGYKGFEISNVNGTIKNEINAKPFGPAPEKGSMLFFQSPLFRYLDSATTTFHWDNQEKMEEALSEKTIDKANCNFNIRLTDDFGRSTYVTDLATALTNRSNLEEHYRVLDETSKSLYKAINKGNSDIASILSKVKKGFFVKVAIDKEELMRLRDDVAGFSRYFDNAVKKEKERLEKEATLPETPYVPQFAAPMEITVKLSTDECQIHSISPFGSKVCKDQDPIIWEEAYDGISEKLYLGFHNAVSGTPISMFIDLTAPTERVEGIALYALNGSNWEKIKLTSDTTSSMNKSGIIRFAFPDGMQSEHSLLPKELGWIRIHRTDRKPLPLIKDIIPHTIELQHDPSSGKGNIGEALPQGTISKPEFRIAGIDKIIQWMDGFPGQEKESEKAFLTRVSERLRHKGRAWNSWDYQRLILERFPSIAAVKCLRSTDISSDGRSCFYAPGSVVLILVPSIKEDDIQLMPKVADTIMSDTTDYIKELASPLARIKVIQPQYEEICVTCKISLRDSYIDKEYYATLTNEALKSLLAPWTVTGEGVEISSSFNESSILAFLENLPWVDYIESMDIKVGSRKIGEGEDIIPEDSMRILTSSKNHFIYIK